jgi:hypothetical protein
VCAAGSEGNACISCSLNYYRNLDQCFACPTGVPIGIVLLCVFGSVFILWIGPKIAAATSPEALGLLRSLLFYLQSLSISLGIRIRWPPGMLVAFHWLSSLTDGIQLAQPECLASGWSYRLYVRLLLAGLGSLFGAAAALNLLTYWMQNRMVIKELNVSRRLDSNLVPVEFIGWQKRLLAPFRITKTSQMIDRLWIYRNSLKKLVVLLVGLAYIYVTGVLLQAWDCIETADGLSVMRTDTKERCDTASHAAFKRWALIVIIVIGAGVPLFYACFIAFMRGGSFRQTLVSSSVGRTLGLNMHSDDSKYQRRLTVGIWHGLSDPAIMFSWGSLYESYKFLRVKEEYVAVDGSAPLHWEWFVWRLKMLRYRLSVRFAPYFESLIFVEKLLLVVGQHNFTTPGRQATAQLVVYALFSISIAVLWPFKRMEVRLPLVFWLPVIPKRWLAAENKAKSSLRLPETPALPHYFHHQESEDEECLSLTEQQLELDKDEACNETPDISAPAALAAVEMPIVTGWDPAACAMEDEPHPAEEPSHARVEDGSRATFLISVAKEVLPQDADADAAPSCHVAAPPAFCRWRKASLGYLWQSHVVIDDAMNWSGFFGHVVPLFTLAIAFAASSSNGVLTVFLIGCNVLTMVFILSNWTICAHMWRAQAVVLQQLRAQQRQQEQDQEEDTEEKEDKGKNSFTNSNSFTQQGALVAKAVLGMSVIEIIRDRSYDEVMACLSFAEKEMAAADIEGRVNETNAIKDVLLLLASFTVARLELHLAAYSKGSRLLATQIVEIEKAVVGLDLVELSKHNVKPAPPGTKLAGRSAKEAEREERLQNIQRSLGMDPGVRPSLLFLISLVLLIGAALVAGLGFTIFPPAELSILPPPPTAPQPPFPPPPAPSATMNAAYFVTANISLAGTSAVVVTSPFAAGTFVNATAMSLNVAIADVALLGAADVVASSSAHRRLSIISSSTITVIAFQVSAATASSAAALSASITANMGPNGTFITLLRAFDEADFGAASSLGATILAIGSASSAPAPPESASELLVDALLLLAKVPSCVGGSFLQHINVEWLCQPLLAVAAPGLLCRSAPVAANGSELALRCDRAPLLALPADCSAPLQWVDDAQAWLCPSDVAGNLPVHARGFVS